MKRISKYMYADSGMKFCLTLNGMNSESVKKAFLALENPSAGLGQVPPEWVDKGWVREVAK